MYAIRSYYDEYLEEQYIEILSKTLRKELGGTAKLEYSVVMENNVYRITSYNVCYTKLLRFIHKFKISLYIEKETKIPSKNYTCRLYYSNLFFLKIAKRYY